MAGHRPSPGPGRRRPEGVGGAPRKLARHRPQAETDAAIDAVGYDLEEAAWFTRPWHDGRHAVRLMETLGVLVGGHTLPAAIQTALTKPVHEVTSQDYAAVEAAGTEAWLTPGPDGIVIPAAAACLANWLANSHGGGVVPNVHLRSTVGRLLWGGLGVEAARWEVGRSRARDLGLGDGPGAEFARLWYQRRYAAAWSISR